METTEYAPHKCPACGHACYLPFAGNPQCTNFGCEFLDEDTFVNHVMSLPDPGDPLPDDIDEEAETNPNVKWVPVVKGIHWKDD